MQSEALLQRGSRVPRDAGHFEPDRNTLNPMRATEFYLIDNLQVQFREESEAESGNTAMTLSCPKERRFGYLRNNIVTCVVFHVGSSRRCNCSHLYLETVSILTISNCLKGVCLFYSFPLLFHPSQIYLPAVAVICGQITLLQTTFFFSPKKTSYLPDSSHIYAHSFKSTSFLISLYFFFPIMSHFRPINLVSGTERSHSPKFPTHGHYYERPRFHI